MEGELTTLISLEHVCIFKERYSCQIMEMVNLLPISFNAKTCFSKHLTQESLINIGLQLERSVGDESLDRRDLK